MRRVGVRSAILLICLSACGQKGTVTFTLEAPASPAFDDLSPLADGRRDSLLLTDEITGLVLGNADATGGPGRALLGDNLPVGTFNVRLQVSGGALLLGLARTRGVTLVGLQDTNVTLHLRKPIAYFGASKIFPDTNLPGPDPLMALDTTLPPSPILPPIGLGSNAIATTSTTDGRWVLVGAGRTLTIIDTLAHRTVQEAEAPANIVALAVSPDDKSAAVVLVSGISILANLPDFIANGGVIPPSVGVPNPRRAVFTPDSTGVTVLSGYAWDQVNCSKPQPSATYTLSVAAPALGTATPAPGSSTGITYGPSGQLLVASPCQKGVLAGDGSIALTGDGIYQPVVAGGRMFGIQGTFLRKLEPVDPDDPSLRMVQLPFAQISVVGGAGDSSINFLVPPDRITITPMADARNPLTQIRLVPTSLIAYDVAASPDGSHLVFNNRIRYEAHNFRFLEVTDSSTHNPVFYCTVDVVEDVYRLSEVDATTGSVGFQSPRGVDDKTCTSQCFDCSFGPCQTNGPASCFQPGVTGQAGYIPSGLSILMGSR